MERSELTLKRGGFRAVAWYSGKSVETDLYSEDGVLVDHISGTAEWQHYPDAQAMLRAAAESALASVAGGGFVVMTDPDGGVITLTTEHPASSYGIPVLVADAEDLKGVFGPSDPLDGNLTAAAVVAAWARETERTEAESESARLFLSQWPEGPQA